MNSGWLSAAKLSLALQWQSRTTQHEMARWFKSLNRAAFLGNGGLLAAQIFKRHWGQVHVQTALRRRRLFAGW